MQDGALGISTSLHQPPGFWVSMEELADMAKKPRSMAASIRLTFATKGDGVHGGFRGD
jgi:hypothetical protein